MYFIRLDDACEYMNLKKWNQMELLLDKYNIRPLVGIIPDCKDPKMKGTYPKYIDFWRREKKWEEKGWAIALHGYQHLYVSKNGGINPVNQKSEFAGVSLGIQKNKIKKGIWILNKHNIFPTVFFAPAHTFDNNTLIALKEESSINIISDTIASNIYYKDNFWYVPLQSGACRKLPVNVATFCYHPNTMKDSDFRQLETFIVNNKNMFSDFSKLDFSQRRKLGAYDRLLRRTYFIMRKIRDGVER